MRMDCGRKTWEEVGRGVSLENAQTPVHHRCGVWPEVHVASVEQACLFKVEVVEAVIEVGASFPMAAATTSHMEVVISQVAVAAEEDVDRIWPHRLYKGQGQGPPEGVVFTRRAAASW